MRILFINPANTPPTPHGILIEPVDVLLLATIVKQTGYHVDVLDMDYLRISKVENLNDYTHIVIVHDYHIPLHNESTLIMVKELISSARSSGIQTIMCGKYATYASDQELLTLGADIYVTNDVESTLSALITPDCYISNIPNLRINKMGAIVHTSVSSNISDLNLLPIPDRSLVNINSYIDVRTILTSRGCHMRCKFCHVPGFWGRWRSRSASLVIDEIKYLYNTTDATKILFLDDNALVNRKRMLDICTQLKTLNLPITLGCLGSIDRVDDELLTEMYAAGFRWIHFGIETGNTKQLIDINKKLTQLQIINAVSLAKKNGFRVRTSVILDLPGSTLDTLNETEDLLAILDVDEIRLHYLAIRMGSFYYQNENPADAAQYIHHHKPGTNLTTLSYGELINRTNKMIKSLSDNNDYTYIQQMDDFNDIGKLSTRSPSLKLISQCPIRYGLAWKL